jgi:hypothetical protein
MENILRNPFVRFAVLVGLALDEYMRGLGRLFAITQAVCTSFKLEIFQAVHNFTASTGHTFKIALYTSSATLGAATTAYSSSNEVSGAGYAAGGNSLVSATPVASGTTAVLDFADTSWTSATITARGALIYNSSVSNKSVTVLDFGSDQVSTAGTFTMVFPVPDASNAILRAA